MLLLTSFIGSLVGFYICYQTFIKLKKINETISMRICMINNMSLSFIFAMFIELTTDSKSLAVILPTITSCIPFVWKESSFKVLDIAEIIITSLMSVAMSVMLIGMTDNKVIWLIQLFLLIIEILLYLSITKKIQHNSS